MSTSATKTKPAASKAKGRGRPRKPVAANGFVMKEENIFVANPSNKKVPKRVARKRITSEAVGNITRRRTEDPELHEILANGEVIGTVRAYYPTPANRKWTLEVGKTVFEGFRTINMAVRAYIKAVEEGQVKS